MGNEIGQAWTGSESSVATITPASPAIEIVPAISKAMLKEIETVVQWNKYDTDKAEYTVVIRDIINEMLTCSEISRDLEILLIQLDEIWQPVT